MPPPNPLSPDHGHIRTGQGSEKVKERFLDFVSTNTIYSKKPTAAQNYIAAGELAALFLEIPVEQLMFLPIEKVCVDHTARSRTVKPDKDSRGEHGHLERITTKKEDPLLDYTRWKVLSKNVDKKLRDDYKAYLNDYEASRPDLQVHKANNTVRYPRAKTFLNFVRAYIRLASTLFGHQVVAKKKLAVDDYLLSLKRQTEKAIETSVFESVRQKQKDVIEGVSGDEPKMARFLSLFHKDNWKSEWNWESAFSPNHFVSGKWFAEAYGRWCAKHDRAEDYSRWCAKHCHGPLAAETFGCWCDKHGRADDYSRWWPTHDNGTPAAVSANFATFHVTVLEEEQWVVLEKIPLDKTWLALWSQSFSKLFRLKDHACGCPNPNCDVTYPNGAPLPPNVNKHNCHVCQKALHYACGKEEEEEVEEAGSLLICPQCLMYRTTEFLGEDDFAEFIDDSAARKQADDLRVYLWRGESGDEESGDEESEDEESKDQRGWIRVNIDEPIHMSTGGAKENGYVAFLVGNIQFVPSPFPERKDWNQNMIQSKAMQTTDKKKRADRKKKKTDDKEKPAEKKKTKGTGRPSSPIKDSQLVVPELGDPLQQTDQEYQSGIVWDFVIEPIMTRCQLGLSHRHIVGRDDAFVIWQSLCFHHRLRSRTAAEIAEAVLDMVAMCPNAQCLAVENPEKLAKGVKCEPELQLSEIMFLIGSAKYLVKYFKGRVPTDRDQLQHFLELQPKWQSQHGWNLLTHKDKGWSQQYAYNVTHCTLKHLYEKHSLLATKPQEQPEKAACEQPKESQGPLSEETDPRITPETNKQPPDDCTKSKRKREEKAEEQVTEAGTLKESHKRQKQQEEMNKSKEQQEEKDQRKEQEGQTKEHEQEVTEDLVVQVEHEEKVILFKLKGEYRTIGRLIHGVRTYFAKNKPEFEPKQLLHIGGGGKDVFTQYDEHKMTWEYGIDDSEGNSYFVLE